MRTLIKSQARMALVAILLTMYHLAIPKENTFSLVTVTGPNSIADHAARSFAPWLSTHVHQEVNVLNMPMGVNIDSSSVFTDEARQCQSLFLMSSSFYYGVLEQGDRGHKLAKNLQPIYGTVSQPAMIIVDKDSPLRNLRDVFTLAARREITVGVPGPQLRASAKHVAQAWNFNSTVRSYGLEIHLAAGLKAGEVDYALTFAAGKELQNAIESGQVRAIAVLSDERSKTYPYVRTALEQGKTISPIHYWSAYFVNKNQERSCVQKLEKTVALSLQSQSWGWQASGGHEISALDSRQMGEYIRNQIGQIKPL